MKDIVLGNSSMVVKLKVPILYQSVQKYLKSKYSCSVISVYEFLGVMSFARLNNVFIRLELTHEMWHKFGK